MIHRLGIEIIPVDESSNSFVRGRNNRSVEPVPMSALRLVTLFSTRLFELALILASSSPIRRQMLANAGVEFEVDAPDLDETSVKAELNDPTEITLKLARAKAESVSKRHPGEWAIGSDSVVSLPGKILSKPADREEAADHLRLFSGKALHLTSAAALARGGSVEWVRVESAALHVRPLSDAFIDVYLEAEWPEVGYCVGVFRLEGRGIQLFQWIEGDYFAILGMPLIPLLGALRERGLMTA